MEEKFEIVVTKYLKELEEAEEHILHWDKEIVKKTKAERQILSEKFQNIESIVRNIEGVGKDAYKIAKQIAEIKTGDKAKAELVGGGVELGVGIFSELVNHFGKKRALKKAEKEIQKIKQEIDERKNELEKKETEALKKQLPERKKLADSKLSDFIEHQEFLESQVHDILLKLDELISLNDINTKNKTALIKYLFEPLIKFNDICERFRYQIKLFKSWQNNIIKPQIDVPTFNNNNILLTQTMIRKGIIGDFKKHENSISAKKGFICILIYEDFHKNIKIQKTIRPYLTRIFENKREYRKSDKRSFNTFESQTLKNNIAYKKLIEVQRNKRNQKIKKFTKRAILIILLSAIIYWLFF